MSLFRMRDERRVNCRSEGVGLFVVDYESNYEILFKDLFFFFFFSKGGRGRQRAE